MTNPFLPHQNVDTVPRQRVTDLSADLDLPTGSPCPGSVSQKKERTRIHVRLARIFPDVEMILANWSAAQKCAENIVKAIRLMDAINKGDLAAALDTCPELGLLIDRRPSTRAKRTTPPSYKTPESNTESESKRDLEGESAVRALTTKCQGLTGDVRKAKLRATAELLQDCEPPFAPTDLDTWMSRVWPEHWKAKKGQARPDLAAIEETIGQVRMLPATPVVVQPASADSSRYLAHEHDDFLTALPEPAAPPIPEWRGQHYDRWLLVRAQYEVALNKSTFETWLKPLKLVRVEGGQFIFTVPNAYTKAWIEQHVLASMLKYFREVWYRAVPPPDIQIAIHVESEYQP